MTKLLLSSSVAGLNTGKAFRLAKEMEVDGVELMPMRWTPYTIDGLLDYEVPITGVHFPFWWHTKSLQDVVASESLYKEKLAALAWYGIIGPGHDRCPAAKLLDRFPDSYALLHPDTYSQIDHLHFLRGRVVFFENERPKNGEPPETHDPRLISSMMIQAQDFSGALMFDPRHIQIAQRAQALPYETLYSLYRELKPMGMHFSFAEEGHPIHPGLPSERTWAGLRDAIREAPPMYIVLEIGPSRYDALYKARDLIAKDLGI